MAASIGGDQTLARHAEVREGRDLDRATLGLDLAERALDLRVEQNALRRALAQDRLLAMRVGAPAGVREEMEARVLDHHRALEQLGQRAADLVDALAVEHELGEAPVDLDRALEAPVLGVDDPLEQRGHQVDELDFGPDREQGDVQAVRLAQHLRRQLADVGQGPHHETGTAGIGDPAHQADLGVGVVFDREAGGEDEVTSPGLHLGRLHQPDPLDRVVEALGAGHQLGAGQDRAHRVTHGGPGLNLRFDPLFRGH